MSPRRSLGLSLLFFLPALAAVAQEPGRLAGGFSPTKEPVSPSGTAAVCDIPARLHMRNTGGMGLRGPGTGAGLCVFTSVEIDANWACVEALYGFQKWMKSKPGGGSPPKLAAMIAAYCRERGVPEPAYVQHTGGDEQFLDLAVKTRRPVGVTYSGEDDYYSGPVDHMVSLVHLDASAACIVDNNRPGVFVWMSRAAFLQRWRARGGGWAVALLDSPPPPKATKTVSSCRAERDGARPGAGPCAWCDGCRCKAGDCPGKCAVVEQGQPCGPGACPKIVDRSPSAVYVSRETGGGRTDAGTGVVIACVGGRSLVVTNAHVVPDGSRPLSVYAAGKRHAAKHVASTRLAPDELDLAALVVEAELPAAGAAREAPPVGTAVYQWGFSGKLPGEAPVFRGGVTVEQGDYTGPKTLRTTIASKSGDSGAGIFTAAGELVGVAWGADERHQFACHLGPTLEWVRAVAPREFVGQKAAAAPAAHANYGIDRDDLDRLTEGGSRRYWVKGREVLAGGAYEALGTTLVDDSDRYFLSAIGDQKALDQVLADPRLARYRDRLHARAYARESWVATDRLGAAVTLREPAPRGGSVVGTLDRLDAEQLVALLSRVFDAAPVPVPQPMPPAPAPAPQPQPAPTTAPEPQPVPQGGGLLLLIGLVGGVIWWLSRK